MKQCVIVCVAASSRLRLRADQITLKNGDRLTAHRVKVGRKNLGVKSELAVSHHCVERRFTQVLKLAVFVG